MYCWVLIVKLKTPSYICFEKFTVTWTNQTCYENNVLRFLQCIHVFYTIQPLLCEKLQNTKVDASSVTWISDFLTSLRMNYCVSGWQAAGCITGHCILNHHSSLSMTQTFSTTLGSVMSKIFFQLLLWVVSEVHRMLNTENQWTTGVET